jgi:hypothetical protein
VLAASFFPTSDQQTWLVILSAAKNSTGDSPFAGNAKALIESLLRLE